METVIIRKSGKQLSFMALASGLLILWYFVGPYEKTRRFGDSYPVSTIILGAVLASVFIYSVAPGVRQKPMITLSGSGIEIHPYNPVPWNETAIVYKLVDEDFENGHKIFLILELKSGEIIKCRTNYLEKTADEIMTLIEIFNRKIEFGPDQRK